jgi:hypothetical protein
MKYLFRASNFGRPPADVFASQVLGHKFEQTDSMLRGLLAERMLRDSIETVAKDYKIIPAVLAGTGHKRWADYDEANGINRKTDKLVGQDVWDEAIAASKCLRNAMAKLNLDPMQAEYQGEYVYTMEGKTKEDVNGLASHAITCTTDFVFPDCVVDTKVMSKPIGAEYADIYNWQMTIQSLATQRDKAYLLVAVQYGDKWIAQLVHPKIYTMKDVENRAYELVEEILGMISLNQ